MKNRIVIDTNLWISFLIGKTAGKLEQKIYQKNLTILYSEELLDEIKQVVKRPKFKKYFSHEETFLLEKIFETVGEKIDVISKVEICRDHKDDFLLSLCKDGLADFLVTSDQDLLVLKKFGKTKIINLNDFTS
ncbi:putative toxin-antitoxin system toxin component, PIN family [bacterium]|nr:putative toxin-antitoxin system toxin component, PIN family [bacterium]